jgi:parallel beta-helix repeat protein
MRFTQTLNLNMNVFKNPLSAIRSAGLIVVFSLLCAGIAGAATYYVDATTGSDDYNGRYASYEGGSNGPWKTLAHVESVTFSDGDMILLKRGQVWHEDLVVPSSGITIDAYGSGAKPILSGSDRVTGWTTHSGNIYKAQVSGTVYQLHQNEDFVMLAHEPDNDFYRSDGARSTRWQITESNWGLSNADVAGANLHVRPHPWFVLAYKISSYGSNTIQLVDDGRNNSEDTHVGSGARYYISNKLWMLDTENEWYHDEASNTLYVWCDSNANPSGQSIYASKRLNGIIIRRKDNVTVNNLDIRHFARTGIVIEDSANAMIQYCDLHDLGQQKYFGEYPVERTNYGIEITGNMDYANESVTIKNNKISDMLGVGIKMYDIDNVTIANNFFDNIGMIGTDVYSPRGSDPTSGTAIFAYLYCNNANISQNTIRNTSYNGIFFNSRNTLVENNTITNTMMYLDDGGAVYCVGDQTDGSRILNNFISVVGDGRLAKQGVYLDNAADGVEVSYNTIQSARRGIFLHSARDAVITHNHVSDVQEGVLVKEDWSSPYSGYCSGNVITDNEIYTVESGVIVSLQGWKNNLDLASSIDRNKYWQDHSEAFFLLYAEDGVWKWDKRLTLSQWYANSGHDANSMVQEPTQAPTYLSPPVNFRIVN